MRQRINAFGLLLGGVPSLENDDDEAGGDSEQSFAEAVLCGARTELESLNRKLCVFAPYAGDTVPRKAGSVAPR
jgi:hypothetical protein